MSTFKKMEDGGYEQIIFNFDKRTGHRSIIAIHDSTLGPTFGGVRMVDYPDEEAALADALRLSRAMTYKCAVVGEDQGGSKSVIWGDPTKRNEEQLRAFGRFVETLKGRFTTGVDLNLTLEDANTIFKETDHIVARAEETGSYGPSGRLAALGVYHGMLSCAKQVWGTRSLEGRSIAIQGLGYVGIFLVPLLVEAGAKLTVTDVSEQAVKDITDKYNVTVVKPEEIYSVQADIFSPNAIGGIINDETIPQLTCSIVAGAANNQLRDEEAHSRMLAERNILYAPDFLINAGGVLQAIAEVTKKGVAYGEYRTRAIEGILDQIFERAKAESITPLRAAMLHAEDRIEAVHRVRRIDTT